MKEYYEKLYEENSSNLDTVSFTYMRSAADCIRTTTHRVPACPRRDKDRLV